MPMLACDIRTTGQSKNVIASDHSLAEG